MTNQNEEPIASPVPVLLSGLLNGAIFCAIWYYAVMQNAEPSRSQLALLNVGFLVSTVVLAQILFRRTISTSITWTKLWMAGCMACLLFALVVSFFYRWYFNSIGEQAPSFAQVVVSYNFMGLVISAIVAFFISRIDK